MFRGRYSAACVALLLPPLDANSLRSRLNAHAIADTKPINGLRALRKLDDLKVAVSRFGKVLRLAPAADRTGR